ncbi:type IV secretion system DNA-binding domain-containing protein [Candidatus Uhrbacteria bacterium]|nr:type IV secretion system DNA-binding domain-containing protein [Candidatus Uhrbacteria bacterium]
MLPLFLFQFDVITETPAASDPLAILDLTALMPLFYALGIFLGIIVVAWLIFLAYRARRVQGLSLSTAFGMKVLMVRVPKMLNPEDAKGDKSQQQIQELIAPMETVFSTIGALKAQKGFKAWLNGRSDLFSFEIVSHRDKISFYVAVPEKMRDFVEQQIHAQYPNAQIDDVPDYNIFSPTGVILGSYLKFRRRNYFPIKTYTKLESDSMNSLTNTLAKVEEGDGVAIQYVVRSAEKSWRTEGLRIARAMQQGKKLKDVERKTFFKSVTKGVSKELSNIASGSSKDKDKGDKGYSLSPLEQEMVKGLEEKASKAGLDVNIRVVVSAKTPERAQRYLDDVLNAYGQFNIYEYGNSFVNAMPKKQASIVRPFIFRQFDESFRMVMAAEEMATVYHLPLPTTETPKINWLLSRKALPPSNLPTSGLLLGHSEYRGHRYGVHIKPEDRRRHMYIIGKSGSGKTEMMKAMVQQDIEEGRGVCVIDPHGDFADDALAFVPKERADDVVFFDPGDFARPMGLNMLEFDPAIPEQKTKVIEEMLKIFDKLYDLKSTGGPMFEQYMRNSMLLLMEHPESGATLLDVPRVLADEEYRNFKLSKCKTQEVRDFWTKEALKAGGEASLQNMVPYITSKLTPFVYNDFVRPIIGQQKSAFNVADVMNGQKILLLKLSKGKIGDLSAYLIGMVLVGKILMAALARAGMDPSERKDFYLYIDEFQNFLTDSIAAILSEARKYGLDLIIAHQFIGQLEGTPAEQKIRDAIFGNVGSMFVNRVGVEDAEFLAKEFAPVFSEYDLVNVEAFTFNCKLLIDNQASKPFNFKPIQARRPKSRELSDMIRELSRYKYGRKRELVEAEIAERREMSVADLSGDGAAA